MDMTFAESLAAEAGKVMVRNFELHMKYELKEDRTPVTSADIEINQMVIERVQASYPKISIIGEEASAQIEAAELEIFLDPIDGTIPYRTGSPISAFCLSLQRRKVPILAVIYDPFTGRMFTAEKGKGAFLNGKAIHVSDRRDITDADLCMLYWRKSPWHVDRMVRKVMQLGGGSINPASIAYYCALTAAGAIDGTVFPGNKPWETSAAKVLVEEAGGVVTNIFGEDDDLSGPITGHIAANPVLHKKLVAIAKDVNRSHSKKKP